ncbi:MAG: S-methyl-5'-thioadenosine phosphorylase [Hyphomicrobiales bacterium]|nr:S-methyl-5'-thioadenosine phosphorylase [Hyphomicrobiales bacterium]
MAQAVFGIIGGSGIYHLPGLQKVSVRKVASPFGEPSGDLTFGEIDGKPIVFLPRHGKGHHLSPSGIPYRANIDAMKRAGVTDLIAVSACGSFRSELYPGMFVLVDQFFDRTQGRENSFFGNGCVAHVSMAHPVSPLLQARIGAAAQAENIICVSGGTYFCMEGPQFSTYAESMFYKAQGFDVIGMTALTEARLAREAEISYAAIAMVTDFDCWHPQHDHVDVESVIRVVNENSGKATRLLARVIADHPGVHEPCPIGSDRALDGAIVTAIAMRDPELMHKLSAITSRVLGTAL